MFWTICDSKTYASGKLKFDFRCIILKHPFLQILDLCFIITKFQETQSQAESQDINATPDTVILPQSYSNSQSQALSLSDFPVTEESSEL